MIVEFSVKNFRSIKDLQTVSFAATKLSSNKEKYPDVDTRNIAVEDDIELLKTIGVYGPNASGKSNLLRALVYFIHVINQEASLESKLTDLIEPFLFTETDIATDCFFQIVFIINEKKYRYGLTVQRNFDKDNKKTREMITGEWLFGKKEKNMVELYTRSDMEIQKDSLPDKEKIPPLEYEHTLFLTHAAAFDRNGICAVIKRYFGGKTISNFSSGYQPFRWNTIQLLEYENGKSALLDLLSSFNITFDQLTVERDEENRNSLSIPDNKIHFEKRFTFGKSQQHFKLNLGNTESEGTKRLFDLAGTLLRAFGMFESTFVILDEIDSNFHPALLIRLIDLFNDPSTNLNNSQLIFTSHDTILMSPAIMRRDQFYFTEKNQSDATSVYSLADLKGIRNDADFAKMYLAGFLGAVPVLEKYVRPQIEIHEQSLELKG
jgi:uncharacterized protein